MLCWLVSVACSPENDSLLSCPLPLRLGSFWATQSEVIVSVAVAVIVELCPTGWHELWAPLGGPPPATQLPLSGSSVLHCQGQEDLA